MLEPFVVVDALARLAVIMPLLIGQSFVLLGLFWLLVAIHELGHFAAAKLLGAHVVCVSIGNGVRMRVVECLGCSWVLRMPSWTEFGWGFVDCSLLDTRGYRWRSVVIFLAGPMAAVLAAAGMFTAVYWLFWVELSSHWFVMRPYLMLWGLWIGLQVLHGLWPLSAKRSEVAQHDVSQMLATVRMSDEQVQDAVAVGVEWKRLGQVMEAALEGDFEILTRVDVEALHPDLRARWHGVRTMFAWQLPRSVVLESLDFMESNWKQQLDRMFEALSERPQGRGRRLSAERALSRWMGVHRAYCLAALFAVDASRTDDLERARELTESMSANSRARADELHTSGFVLLMSGNRRRAKLSLERAFRMPVDPWLRAYQATYLAVCAARDGRRSDASRYLRKARAIDEKSPALQFFGPEIEAALVA